MSLYPIPSKGVVPSPPRVSIMSTRHIRVLSIVCLRNFFKDVLGGTYDGLSDEFFLWLYCLEINYDIFWEFCQFIVFKVVLDRNGGLYNERFR